MPRKIDKVWRKKAGADSVLRDAKQALRSPMNTNTVPTEGGDILTSRNFSPAKDGKAPEITTLYILPDRSKAVRVAVNPFAQHFGGFRAGTQVYL